MCWDFPGGPVVRTPCFHCRGNGFDWGTRIPHAVWHGQKKKKVKKECVTQFTMIIKYTILFVNFI